MNKSLLWKEIKELGNPFNTKWTTSVKTMFDNIQTYHMQQELNRFAQFEFRPERKEKVQVGDYFMPEMFMENDLKVDNTTFKIPEANKDIATKVSDLFKSQPIGSVVKINERSFTVKANTSKNVQEVFEQLYPDEIEMAVDFYNDEVEAEPDNQVMRLGNVNCLLNPIKLQIQSSIDNSESKTTIKDLNKIMNKLIRLEPLFEQQGATPELIKRLADATQSRISIYEVVSQKEIEYKADKVKRRFHFKFQNISINHVQLWSGKNETQVIDNIYEKHEELVDNNQTFKYQIVNKQIVKIDCGTDTFIDSDYMKLKDAEDEINDQTRDLQINIKQRIPNDYFGDLPNSQIPFLQQAIQVGGCMKLKDVKDSSKLKHIDMITGYAQFQHLPDIYKFGVPYMTEFRKVTSVDFAIKHNGIYECTIMQLTEAIKAVLGVRQRYLLYSNLIKFLVDRGVKISIIGGMYGKHSKHITLSESSYEKHCGRKAYYTAFSKYGIVSDSFDQKIHCGDRHLAGIIRGSMGYRMVSLDNDNYNMNVEIKQKPNMKTRSHVYTYILQCQQINLMMQLEKMDMSKVTMLVGDDIYYEEHQFEQLPSFRPKGENKYDLMKDFADSTYLRIPHESDQSFEYGEQEGVYNQYELHQGAGGFGKTHTRLSDIGSIGVVYTTLTNQLVDEQKKSKFQAKAYTSAKIIQKIAEKKLCCSNLIIDECSLVGINTLQNLKLQLPYCRIYVLGDDLQISDGDKEIFNPQHYDKVVTEEHYKTDYRASRCPELQALKQSIRKAMRLGKNEMEIYTELVQPVSQQTTCKQFIKNYNSQKMIAVCSNQQKDKVTDGLKAHNKYRVNKCFVLDGKKYNTGQILYELPEGYDYKKDLKNKQPRLSLQHGYTCHSLQGMTHNNEILITKPIGLEIFRGFCYTAVSRLTSIKHLFTI